MAGDDFIAFNKLGAHIQLLKLHKPIAVDAGIGGISPFICRNKTTDDLFSEIIGKIENAVWNTEPSTDAGGILGIRKGAAGLFT